MQSRKCPANLTTRYYVRNPASKRRAELPRHDGILPSDIAPVDLLLTVTSYGPRTSTTRMGIRHREVTR